ncbi:MAG: TaqI-like C-terminal specificity domain-containing protein, partial [Promethearchaeota archaeon]
KNHEILLDLEPLYESHPKIFFKFISDRNIFGYSNEQYYATSDTYFLWPKSKERDIDYLFILAYLNSKIVHFLYRSKNIKIKRSKTKLEQTLPIPNLKNFKSPDKIEIIKLIKVLTNFLSNNNIQYEKVINSLLGIGDVPFMDCNEFKIKIVNAIKDKNYILIKNIIDDLFFQLFNISEIKVNSLLKKYYNP